MLVPGVRLEINSLHLGPTVTNLPGWGFVECNGQELVLRFFGGFFFMGKNWGKRFGEGSTNFMVEFFFLG